MTLSLLALLLAAAALHACWGLLLKRAPDRQRSGWWAVIASAVCCVPVRGLGAASYTGRMFLLAAVVFTPVTIRWYGWPALRGALRTRAALILLVGLLQAAAYLLVLYVYARAPVAYAGAIRESSIVLGALAGWLWLRESFGARRLAGALVTCAGIALIALAG